jgi:hypothetical protein
MEEEPEEFFGMRTYPRRRNNNRAVVFPHEEEEEATTMPAFSARDPRFIAKALFETVEAWKDENTIDEGTYLLLSRFARDVFGSGDGLVDGQPPTADSVYSLKLENCLLRAKNELCEFRIDAMAKHLLNKEEELRATVKSKRSRTPVA